MRVDEESHQTLADPICARPPLEMQVGRQVRGYLSGSQKLRGERFTLGRND